MNPCHSEDKTNSGRDHNYNPILIDQYDPKQFDITLTVKEREKKQDFRANKAILANKSDVFKSMFSSDYGEVKDRLDIKDVPIESFKRLLDVFYTGKLDIFACEACLPAEPPPRDSSETCTNYTRQCIIYRKNITTFWSIVQQLVQVAARFKATETVMQCFEEGIDNNYCDRETCSYCLNLFLLARMYKLQYNHEKQFTHEDFRRWDCCFDKSLVLKPVICYPFMILEWVSFSRRFV